MSKSTQSSAKPTSKEAAPLFDVGKALLHSYITNEKVNQFMLAGIAAEVWRAESPAGGRTIAAIVAHMHNVRVMWLKVAAKDAKIPAQLDRHTVTVAQAKKALKQSAAALTALLKKSLATGGKISNFKPDVAGFFGYLIAHDAHHRGQVTMLARQLGHPIPQATMFGMWEWNSRGKEK
jgi:uncharacterized damage-inducible protein DinB